MGLERIIQLYLSSVEPHPKSCTHFPISGQACSHTSTPGDIWQKLAQLLWLVTVWYRSCRAEAEFLNLETSPPVGQIWRLMPDWPIFSGRSWPPGDALSWQLSEDQSKALWRLTLKKMGPPVRCRWAMFGLLSPVGRGYRISPLPSLFTIVLRVSFY